jgi:hypothetical protein
MGELSSRQLHRGSMSFNQRDHTRPAKQWTAISFSYGDAQKGNPISASGACIISKS